MIPDPTMNQSSSTLVALQNRLTDNLSTQKSRMQLIKESFPVLYVLLTKLSAGASPAQQQNLVTNFFMPGQKHIKTCRYKITYSYVCRTCQQDKQAKICFLCFDTSKHQNHNYYVQQTNGECQCGIPGFGNYCYTHKNGHDYFQENRIQIKYEEYAAFFVEFLIVYINMKPETRRQLEKPIKQIFQKIYTLNQRSLTHIKISHICLSSIFSQIKQPFQKIIQKLLFINYTNLLPEYITKLIKLFANNYAPFQLLLVNTAFKIKTQSVYTMNYLKGLQSTVKKLIKSVPVLGSMAIQGNVIYPNNTPLSRKIQYQTIFRDMIDRPNRYKEQQKYLIPIFKVLMQKDSIPSNGKVDIVEFMLNKASSDLSFMQKLVQKLIVQKTYQSGYQKSDNQWYNVIVRGVLCAVYGQVQQFAGCFKNIKMDTIRKLVQFYFWNILRIKRKCQFNGLTAKCLIKLAQQFDMLKYVKDIPIQNAKQINCNKFTENIFVVLRNLIASDHMNAFWLLKIAELKKNRQKIKIYQQFIIEWFRDFLYVRQQTPKYLIKSLKAFGIINFKQALAVLEKETQFNQDRKIFIYKGQQRNINKDSLFSQSSFLTLLSDIKYKDYSRSLFFTEQRKQILMTLLDENITKVTISKYSSYPKEERHRICLTAIIIDNILEGQSANVSKYLESLRQANLKFTKKDKVLLKLFNMQTSEIRKQTVPSQTETMVQIKSQPLIQQQKIKQITQPLIASTPLIPQKKLTQAQLAAKHKRQQKMHRLKQKFAHKSQKYSHHQILSKPTLKQQQFCLICRQQISRQKQKSFLFYLASLKTDQLTQMLFGIDSQLMVSSCFHPFHQKCINNSNNNTTMCTLCKTQGNFILPVINDSMESQIFVKAWWDDFIALKSFTPKPANPYGYGYYNYSNYNNPTTKKPQPQNVEQANLNEKPKKYKNFLIIYKCLIFRISSIVTKTKWQDTLQKHTYFINLIKFFINQLDKKQRSVLAEEIKDYDIQFQEKKVNQYVKDLSRIASKALQLKFELYQNVQQKQKMIQKVIYSCEQLNKKYAQNLIQNFLKNIQWLLILRVSPEQSVESQKNPISSSQVLKYLYKLQLPQTMQQCYKLRQKCQKCQKCNQMNSWHCLFCKVNGCKNCQPMHNHVKTAHGNNILFIMTSSGRLVNVSVNGIVKEIQLYFDFMGDAFYEETSLELKDYKYDSRKVNNQLDALFKKF